MILRLVFAMSLGTMVAFAVARDMWELRMMPDGFGIITLLGLAIAWVGASFIFPLRCKHDHHQ